MAIEVEVAEDMRWTGAVPVSLGVLFYGPTEAEAWPRVEVIAAGTFEDRSCHEAFAHPLARS